ncbi:MAG: hypothetical protein ACO38W_13625, partial [Phycisphaerales bacterium]
MPPTLRLHNSLSRSIEPFEPEGASIDPGDPAAIADFYASRFLEDALLLGLRVAEEAEGDPSLMPRPTRFVPQMIELVERLVAKGCAYVASDGAVYFDVQSFPDYGRLSGNSLEALRAGEGERRRRQGRVLRPL